MTASSTYLADEFKKRAGHRSEVQGQARFATSERGSGEGEDRTVLVPPQTEVNLPFITADASGSEASRPMKLTRSKLESLVDEPHFQRTKEPL